MISKDKEVEYFERLMSDLKEFVITKQFRHQSFIDKLINFLGSSDNAKTLLKKIDEEDGQVKTKDEGNMPFLIFPEYINTTSLIKSTSGG